ncbi:hypothetical protein HYPSUDRAFT_191742 [Hypholoma sublateritium FD-334 SS-4]|uniref:Beta-lactamase-related domain-containing protein n=1 Tax=Hypholoma sublateritium (strain FD-334 SS-4) TaxID=945553 RepID=A0A0D2NFM1_HYPSF|nr:hypothetical protein HYPSUDRAFT_191742 [Hypholoma sublateritium FD-334 SS-4]
MVALTQSGKTALDNIADNLTAEKTLPGFVIGATNAEEEIYFNSGGYKTLNDPTSGKIDQDAVLWICSMTKFVTHIAALQLLEQGKLELDTPVSQYFPQLSNPIVLDDVMSQNPTFKPANNIIRVKHLLNFTSGLFYQFTMDFGISLPPPYSREHDMNDPHSQFFSILQGELPGIPLQFEPGTNFAYGYSSDVLGFIVEKISGKTLEEYMKENIFKPLDINASFFLTPELKDRLFPLYFREQDGELHLWDNQPMPDTLEHDPTKVSRLLGGVGLYTSLRDYLKLLRHILQIYGDKATNPILKQDTVKAMFVGTLDEVASKGLTTILGLPPKSLSWSNALATCEADYPGGRKKGSAFWSGWAGTHFFIDPATGIAVVYGSQIASLQGGPFDTSLLKGRDAFEETLYANLTS